MTDPPLLSIPKSKGLGAGEEEDAPAVKGPVGISHRKILPEQTEGVVAMMIRVLEPAFRGAGVVLATIATFVQLRVAEIRRKSSSEGMVPPLKKWRDIQSSSPSTSKG